MEEAEWSEQIKSKENKRFHIGMSMNVGRDTFKMSMRLSCSVFMC